MGQWVILRCAGFCPNMPQSMCRLRIGNSQGLKQFQATPAKQHLNWYLLGVVFKISNEHPRLFLYRGSLGGTILN